ncbi:hypothetical protein BN3087_660023 [Sulfurovum sp. enrichment culture clone C5]|uniref:Uncharacterized protein n=1 Tax=Sulfurovum sp. enrichment culture clone C5 TaxID=497650 RepID=A0A0S4XR28_9BACT|nr:hypothetical protein BN3087_660023 [Sulfurovum sp. enrichment culture clone C5]
MPQIPNTDLTLTEAEIQKQNKEEFEVPERFQNIINTGRTKGLHKDSPLILQPHQGYYREEDEIRTEFLKERVNTGRLRNKEGKLPVPPIEYSYFIEDETTKNKNDYRNSDEHKKYFNKNGKNITIDLDDCSILTKEMLQEKN